MGVCVCVCVCVCVDKYIHTNQRSTLPAQGATTSSALCTKVETCSKRAF